MNNATEFATYGEFHKIGCHKKLINRQTLKLWLDREQVPVVGCDHWIRVTSDYHSKYSSSEDKHRDVTRAEGFIQGSVNEQTSLECDMFVDLKLENLS